MILLVPLILVVLALWGLWALFSRASDAAGEGMDAWWEWQSQAASNKADQIIRDGLTASWKTPAFTSVVLVAVSAFNLWLWGAIPAELHRRIPGP